MRIDRRTLLVGGGAGLGLVVAWAAWPRRFAPGLPIGKGEQVFGHYLKVGTDGRVTVAVPQVETGQGIWTALPQLLADELGADWTKVAVIPAPVGRVYDNQVLGGRGRTTAAATSVRAFAEPMRQAGATARIMLCAAAAKQWGVAAGECDTAGGFVLHEGKRLPFAALAEAAAQAAAPEDAPLRNRPAGLAAQPLPRVDGPPKSDGSMRFAADVRLPGQVYAAALIGRPAGEVPKGLHRGEGWVAAVADTSWAARRALAAAAPAFQGSRGDDDGITQAVELALAGNELPSLTGRTVTADYAMAPVPHLGLEPPAATARWVNGQLEAWASTQQPDALLAAIGGGQLYPMPVGSPDGVAMSNPAAPIAVELARRLGRPVQVVLSPAHARAVDPVLAPARARLRAQLGPDNRPIALAGQVAGLWPSFPYAVGRVDVRAAQPAVPITAGYLRGQDGLFAAFARESFIDELARQVGSEPLAFRISLLPGKPRLARVLSTAAAIGGWDGGGSGSSLGLAAHSAYGSHIALLASATIGGDGQVAVDRLVCAVDCGRVVNPQLVRQQVESGLIAALAYARAPAPSFRDGLLRSGGGVAPTLAGTPRIEVEVIPSAAEPGGLSGLSTAVLAPAVGNAVAAASGRRLRALPFDPMSEA
ncbi:molybdopterin-dependent oxidoreductase [Sphingomonas sp. BN140010]|uniref:Molybdopterin-dependent oxidoreductase n=1 Tax=Sphingomonas arvum TaxID=2992113 RepID=A0ABT3JG83_9SPHN|nr:molybdopterin cofactor-binding domain-containing protein [Sphingomonas sp. BN140010]MCW3798098.1 molybdopterin-dependent oxidoreductase [Sphingomonas sp. BN140010]